MAAEGRGGAGALRARALTGLVVLAALLAAMPAAAAEGNSGSSPGGTGLPLPRFASLRADEVNLRAGPGVRYPVEWVYRRRGLPVQIIAEFDAWRKVRDWRGTEGWMHRSVLTGRRMALVTAAEAVLRREPRAAAPAVARAERGVVARLLACAGAWCRIEARGFGGWVERAGLWGMLPGEKLD